MYNHPLNLALRFFLELAGLYAMGYWGWTQHSGPLRWAWMLGLPLLAATLWGAFRVPNDPGKAPVPVPGPLRLLLEAAFFGGATLALFAAGQQGWGWVFGLVVLGHYLVSYDRVLRMLRGRAG